MAVIREVRLHLRADARNRACPPVLNVRVYDHTNQCGGGWFELRGEVPSGAVTFAFRDGRKFLVMEEFESTVNDLLADYIRGEVGAAVDG